MAQKEKHAPSFIIKLNGTRLATEKEADIKEIIVEENIDKPSFSRIVISDSKGSWADSSDVELGTTVKISLGYKDDVKEVFQGEITGINSKFIEKSGTSFEIQSYNKLHRLLRVKKTKSFNKKKPSEIIEQIAGDAGLSKDVDSLGSEMKFCIQRNKSDYDYIMEIARKYNCKVYMDEDKLCCKKLKSGGQDDVVVEWNKSLLDFQVEMNSLQLATAVEVRGWDVEKLEAIVGTKTHKDISVTIGGNDVGGKVVEDGFGKNKIIVIDNNIIDKDSAEALALALLTENSFNYVIAKGKIIGNAEVKAGSNMSVKSVGTKFSGSYYVKTVRHCLSVDTGYSTFITLTRNAV